MAVGRAAYGGETRRREQPKPGAFGHRKGHKREAMWLFSTVLSLSKLRIEPASSVPPFSCSGMCLRWPCKVLLKWQSKLALSFLKRHCHFRLKDLYNPIPKEALSVTWAETEPIESELRACHVV